MTTHGKPTVSGDQPHYLIIAESLFADHDLDLENNFRNNDGRRFGADGMVADLHERRTPSGRLWSAHDVGLAVLLLPVYAVSTRAAAYVPVDVLQRFRQTQGLFAFTLINFALTLMTAWAASLLLSGLRRRAVRDPTWVVLILALSPPVVAHSFTVFPETPAFAVACAAVWLICLGDAELSIRRMALVILAVGLLPWLHRKYSFFSLGLAFLVLWQQRSWVLRQRRAILLLLGGLAAVPQLAMHLWTFHVWGNLGGPLMIGWFPFSITGVQTGALGMLFDRERGLFAYAPIYLLAPACWALTWRENRILLLPFLALFLPMSSFIVWWAGYSPAARFLVPLTPLVSLPAARALEHRAIRRAAIPLLVFQLAIVLVAWQYPRRLWPRELGTNELLETIPFIGRAYEQSLPSILTGDSLRGAWIWVVAVSIVTALLFAITKRRSTR